MPDDAVPALPEGVRVQVPDESTDWEPEGYTPGPDDPGDVDTECGPGPEVSGGEGE